MIKIFASGLAANLVFVFSGLLKQYLIAGSLSVEDFGAYGSLLALASLLLVLMPFPTYLNVMIFGFSAPPDAFGTRKRLIIEARAEMITLTAVLLVALALVTLYGLLVTEVNSLIGPVLLLLLAQYLVGCLDLLLRMQQAHSHIALFMMLRNVPAIVLLLSFSPILPMQVAIFDCVSAVLITVWFINSRIFGTRRVPLFRLLHWRINYEQRRLWLARIAQFANSSMLRIIVPLSFGAHDIGLFFFALIAQLPCSLFLSVTTQIYGHILARLQRGDWATLFRIQISFALPNLIYVFVAAVALQFWEPVVSNIPNLAKYSDAGPLILAVVSYSAVLASDCQEYLLRSRKMSGVLLLYSTASVLAQIVCVTLGATLNISLTSIIYLCAVVQAGVLISFSFYSFKKTIGITALESIK